MKLSKYFIKSLIIESLKKHLIVEGIQDTVARSVGLIDPVRIEQIRIASEKPHKLQKPDLLWLAKYFMSDEGSKSNEPIEDIVASIKNFKRSGARLSKAGKSKNMPDYKTPAELAYVTSFSSGYLHKDDPELEKQAQKIYDSPDWQVWMPFSREASCTLGSETSWCTAIRSRGNNLFYNYILRKGVILYYVVYVGNKEVDMSIKKMALGFIRDDIQFAEAEGQGFGGITVDATNNGITKQRFINSISSVSNQIVAQDIINKIIETGKNIGGVHPAATNIKEMLNNPVKLRNENVGKTKVVIIDFITAALEYAEAEEVVISDQVLDVMKQLSYISLKDIQKVRQSEETFELLDSVQNINNLVHSLNPELVSNNWYDKNIKMAIIDKDAKIYANNLFEEALLGHIKKSIIGYCQSVGHTLQSMIAKEINKKGGPDSDDLDEFFDDWVFGEQEESAIWRRLYNWTGEGKDHFKDTDLSDRIIIELTEIGFYIYPDAPSEYSIFNSDEHIFVFDKPKVYKTQ